MQGCPGAKVVCERVDNYPVTVRVMTHDRRVLWKGSQKKLFGKYAADRSRSMAQIAKAVASYASTGDVPPQPAKEEKESGGGCAVM